MSGKNEQHPPLPSALPTCRHGKLAGSFRGCRECSIEHGIAVDKTTELVKRFWDNRGRNAGDLEHLMALAFRFGREFEREGK